MRTTSMFFFGIFETLQDGGLANGDAGSLRHQAISELCSRTVILQIIGGS